MTCSRCGHRRFHWWVTGVGIMEHCLLCGDLYDDQVAVNRFLMGLGCRSPKMFAAGYKAITKRLIEREVHA